MEKYNQEVDLNCTANILCVLQQLEREIAKAKQVLQHLEATGTLHKINVHERRKYLKEYLDILYQVRAFLSLSVVKQYLTILLKHLQVIFRRNDGRINTPVEVWLLKCGATLPLFLVKSISPLPVVKKRGIQQHGSCAEMAATLCDGLYLIVPTSTLIICPVSTEAKKRPLKENEGQNENTGKEPAITTNTAHNANGMLDGAGPLAVSVSKNNSHSASDVDVAASFTSSGNGDGDASNLPSSNNSEEPLPLELQSAPVPLQWQLLECDMIPVTMASQDTNEHIVSDDSHQQPLYDDSGGQTSQSIPLSQLGMEIQVVASFNLELSTNLYQQQSYPSDDPPAIPPLAPTIDPVQESSHGQSDVTMLSTTCHADEVSSEEQLVMISAVNDP